MARQRPKPWNDEQVAAVKELLTSFCNDADTVCACMDCHKEDLNWLCRQAFGPNMTFAKTVEKYRLVGKAKLQKALMRAAMDEKPNSKALDFVIREYLDILGPIERRHKVQKEMREAERAEKPKEQNF